MKNIKLYNVFFPIWFLLLFPVTWIIAMPVNFVIDSIVILLSLKFLKIDDIYQKYKKVLTLKNNFKKLLLLLLLLHSVQLESYFKSN